VSGAYETVVYDTGALIGVERSSQAGLARHRGFLAHRLRVVVPSPVAAQVVREPKRQAPLMSVLRACDIVPFGTGDYSPVGQLLAKAGTSDVIDAFVALTAAKARAAVITSDPRDIGHLLDTLGLRLPVITP
jgi:predicted nucleic acid-binding protein